MNTQKNMALVKRVFDEVYTKSNLLQLDQFFSNDLILHDPAVHGFKGGLAAYKKHEEMYAKAFKKTLKIDEIIGENDKIIVRWTCKGTHIGPLEEIPATGKNFTITGISIYTFKNDKIVQIDQDWDRLSLFEQLGALETVTALH